MVAYLDCRVVYTSFEHVSNADDDTNVSTGERAPVHADRNSLPYTMSVVSELLRIDVAQRSVPHCTTEEVVVQGHTIPKGESK